MELREVTRLGNIVSLNLYYPVGVSYQSTIRSTPSSLSNPYLEWEKTQKIQFGLELGFLNDRVLLNMSYARNQSSNQLLHYSLPTIAGIESVYRNFPATIQNTSWELSLNTTNIHSSRIIWSSSINLTVPKNELISFPDIALTTYANALKIGQPISVQRGYHFLGVDEETGRYTVADANGKPTSSPDDLLDKNTYLSTSPRLYGGINNSFSFQGFQLDFLFQFVKQSAQGMLFNNGSSIIPGEYNAIGSSNQPIQSADPLGKAWRR